MHQVVLWALHVEQLQRPSDKTVVLDHGAWSLFYQMSTGSNVIWVSVHQRSGQPVVHKVAAAWDGLKGWVIDDGVAPWDLTQRAINQLQGR